MESCSIAYTLPNLDSNNTHLVKPSHCPQPVGSKSLYEIIELFLLFQHSYLFFGPIFSNFLVTLMY